MKRSVSKPPSHRPPFPGGKGNETPSGQIPGVVPSPAPANVSPRASVATVPAGTSVGTRIGLGIAIGLFSSIAVVIGCVIIVKLIGWQAESVASSGAASDLPSTELPRQESSQSSVLTVPDPDRDVGRRSTDSPAVSEPADRPDPSPEQGQPDEPPMETEPQSESQPDPDPQVEEPDRAEQPNPPAEELAEASEEALTWVRQLQGRKLTLPSRTAFVASKRTATLVELTAEQKELVSRGNPKVSQVALKLLGAEVVYGENAAVSLERARGDEHHEPKSGSFLADGTWVVRSRGAQDGGDIEIGWFAIEDNCLIFSWERRGAKSSAASLLKFCLLEISTGTGNDQRAVCRLADPIVVKSSEVDPMATGAKIELSSLDVDRLPAAKNLRMDVMFDGFPDHERATDEGVGVDKVLVTTFFVDGQSDDEKPGVEIGAKFELEEHPVVRFEVAAYPDRLIEELEDSQRTTLNARDLAAFKREYRTKMKLLVNQQGDLVKVEQVQKRNLQAIELQIRTAPIANRELLQQRQLQLQSALADIQTAKSENLSESEQLDLEKRWREQVVSLLSKRNAKRQISLKLAIEIDDQAIVIAAPKPAAQDR
jgi:hypothetical protein